MFGFSLILVLLATICACSSMPKFHDPFTRASHAGMVSLSKEKLEIFKRDFTKEMPSLKAPPLPDDRLVEHLRLGDSRAAIVMKTDRYLVIAAYTDELDCVAMLRFSKEFADLYNLKEGSRLLTVNTYGRRKTLAEDLYPGPKTYRRYTNVYPLIAEFLSDDMARISKRKNEISEEEWSRTWNQGKEYIDNYGHLARNGNPYFSMIPAKTAGPIAARQVVAGVDDRIKVRAMSVRLPLGPGWEKREVPLPFGGLLLEFERDLPGGNRAQVHIANYFGPAARYLCESEASGRNDAELLAKFLEESGAKTPQKEVWRSFEWIEIMRAPQRRFSAFCRELHVVREEQKEKGELYLWNDWMLFCVDPISHVPIQIDYAERYLAASGAPSPSFADDAAAFFDSIEFRPTPK